MSAIRSPCKCPVCDYISTRHWNVKSHIKKKHGGIGEPMRVYGRRELAFGRTRFSIPSHEYLITKFNFMITKMIENQFFDMQ